jgi:hypothetical protein
MSETSFGHVCILHQIAINVNMLIVQIYQIVARISRCFLPWGMAFLGEAM